VTTTTMTPAKPNWTRTAMLGGGALALAGAGLAAGLMLRSPPPAAEPARVAEAPAAVAPIAAPAALTNAQQAPVQPAAATPATVDVPHPAPVARKAPVKSERSPRHAPATNDTVVAQHDSSRPSTPIETQPAAAPVCANCGVVESVHAFEKKGEGSGAGAVAGGLLGGVLGNQVGKGNGRAAMTVLGAIGGGMAGHEIEKRTKSETMYEVRVHMEDGTTRTITQKTAPAPGSRVVVEGSTLRSADGQAAEPRMVRTTGQGA